MNSSHMLFTNHSVSDRIARVRPLYTESPIYRRAGKLRQQGESVIDLSGNCINEPPPSVLEDVRREAASGFPAPELRGIRTLREAIARKESEDRKMRVDPDSQVIVFGGGAMMAINFAIQTVVNPNDEVIVLTPCFTTDEMIRMAGGKPVFAGLNEQDGFAPDFDRIEEHISSKTKMIVVNNPHNPTGYVWKKDELKRLAELAVDHDLMILSDEVFRYFVFDGATPTFLSELSDIEDHLISICSATKTYGMFNWRLSWLTADPLFIKQIEKLLFWNCEFAPPMTQVGLESAIRNGNEWLKLQTREMEKRRDILFSGLEKIEGIKVHRALGGPTMFPNVSRLEKSSMKFANYLLDEAKVLVAPGIFYIGDGHMRVAFWGSGKPLSEKEMHEAVERMQQFVPRYDPEKYRTDA